MFINLNMIVIKAEYLYIPTIPSFLNVLESNQDNTSQPHWVDVILHDYLYCLKKPFWHVS